MGAVISALTGSNDKSEVAVMAKQATEVNQFHMINILIMHVLIRSFYIS